MPGCNSGHGGQTGPALLTKMRAIDSHTGGQPTRVILDGGPELGSGPLSERLRRLSRDFDCFRKRTILEPKCADSMVGALLCEPEDKSCSAGVIFFNSAGYLGMCGHGLIGLMVTLVHLGRLSRGAHLVETPVGIVKTEVLGDNQIRFQNVDSFRIHKNLSLDLPAKGVVKGDVAWGGNNFFLADCAPCSIEPVNIEQLTEFAWSIRRALNDRGIVGFDGGEIDHIELFQPGVAPAVNSRSFVLCPGGAYDRSPCGTGTSAKLACLAADGKLKPGEIWVQESVVGSQFTANYAPGDQDGHIKPNITGSAYVFAESNIIFNDNDPFERGMF